MAFPEPGVFGAADVTRGEFRTAIEDFLAATVAGVAAHGRQAFTASATFTVPAGVTQIWARAVGGGGGGGGSWLTGAPNNATAGVNGEATTITRSGTALVSVLGGIRGTQATPTGDGTDGLWDHTMLPPYGTGGSAASVLGTSNRGGDGGASEGAFALLSVSAGQELVIVIGAGGNGGNGCVPGGSGGNDGNSGIVLLEW